MSFEILVSLYLVSRSGGGRKKTNLLHGIDCIFILFQPLWPVETKVDTNPVYVDPVYVDPPVVPEPPSTTPVVPSSGDHDPSKKTPSRTSFFAQPGTLAGKL